MPMPPGFYVAMDKKLVRSYKVHDRTRVYIGEAKAYSLEIIESLLFETFGLHFLEPIDEVIEVPVARLQIAKLPPTSNSQASSKLNIGLESFD